MGGLTVVTPPAQITPIHPLKLAAGSVTVPVVVILRSSPASAVTLPEWVTNTSQDESASMSKPRDWKPVPICRPELDPFSLRKPRRPSVLYSAPGITSPPQESRQ